MSDLAATAAEAARAVPGVERLQPGIAGYVTSTLGDRHPGVRIDGNDLRVQLVVRRGERRVRDVAAAARTAVSTACGPEVRVTVLVTEVL